jgi:poly(A) polymerase
VTRITAPWLTSPDTTRLFDLFAKHGFQLLCVGGCVRNSLLNMPVSDIDMASDARPDDVIRIAEAAKLRVIPTGIDHGTVTAISGGTAYEITTFRSDVETDGRHAKVAFSDTYEEDAKRRDFTINALYVGPDGAVLDAVQGLPDIAARRIRFIGDASARITEDTLRILRFFRFYAWYGDPDGGIDPDGLAACAQGAEGLEGLSAERIGAEMIKLLNAPDPSRAIAAMQASGVLARVMPGADAALLPVLVHFEAKHPPIWTRRAMALGGEPLKDRWRLSKADAEVLSHGQEALAHTTDLSEIAYRHGASLARDVALARAASLQNPPPAELENTLAQAASATFPVKATDLMPALQGPALGARLKELETRWIASGFNLSKADLLGE